jgi:hypothetical protein
MHIHGTYLERDVDAHVTSRQAVAVAMLNLCTESEGTLRLSFWPREAKYFEGRECFEAEEAGYNPCQMQLTL